jgi:hypothetical protein
MLHKHFRERHFIAGNAVRVGPAFEEMQRIRVGELVIRPFCVVRRSLNPILVR